jgi:hypothetical protein
MVMSLGLGCSLGKRLESPIVQMRRQSSRSMLHATYDYRRARKIFDKLDYPKVQNSYTIGTTAAPHASRGG